MRVSGKRIGAQVAVLEISLDKQEQGRKLRPVLLLSIYQIFYVQLQ